MRWPVFFSKNEMPALVPANASTAAVAPPVDSVVSRRSLSADQKVLLGFCRSLSRKGSNEVYLTYRSASAKGFRMPNDRYKAALLDLVGAGFLKPRNQRGKYRVASDRERQRAVMVDWANEEPDFWSHLPPRDGALSKAP